MTLTDSELERYSRQLVLPEWSGEAQERVRGSSAIVVGAGALGSPAATYLAAAGLGRIETALAEAEAAGKPLVFPVDISLTMVTGRVPEPEDVESSETV